MRMKKVIFWLLIVFSPFWIVLGRHIIFVFFPFHIVFNTCFWVENETTQAVIFSPVGRVTHTQFVLLPQYAIPFVGVIASKQSRHNLGPGSGRFVCYNWDNVSFTGLHIETQSGESRALFVEPPQVVRYKPPENWIYRITADNLREKDYPIIEDIEKAIAKSRQPEKAEIYRQWAALVFVFAWVGALLMFLFLRRKHVRKTSR
jgi:hypothetical protein